MERTTHLTRLICVALLAGVAACDAGGAPESGGFELPSAPGADLPRATGGDDGSETTGPAFDQGQDDDPNSGSHSGTPAGGPGAIGEGGAHAPSGGADDEPGLGCLELYDGVSVCYDAYYGCVNSCQDLACADPCETTYWSCYDGTLNQGTPLGQEQFGDLRTCEETHYQGCYAKGETVYNDCAGSCVNETCTKACADDANDSLMQCMVDVCGLVYQICGVQVEGDNETGSAGGTEEPGSWDDGSSMGDQATACSSLYECEDACNGEQACGQACYDAADSAAQALWSALIQCGIQHCNKQVEDAQSYKACLQQQCSDAYASCFGGTAIGDGGQGANGGNGGAGEAGADGPEGGACGAGYVCIQGCYATATDEASFYGCVDACYAAMDDTATDLLDALGGCSNIQCADVQGSIENYYQCQQDFCPGEYNACMNQPSGPGGSGGGWNDPGGDNGNPTCADIYAGVFEICIPAYSVCTSGCNSDACVQACQEDIDACIAQEQSLAPGPEAGAFEAVTQCRSTNYQACYDSSNTAWQGCMASCMPGDSSCESACNEAANQSYEDCFVPLCLSEYQTCGIV